jgi:hypothetical protein
MKADGFGGVWRGRALLGAALLSCWVCAARSQAQSRQGALVGKPAPSFQLQGIYDEAYSLDQFKGHILVMQFGSSW